MEMPGIHMMSDHLKMRRALLIVAAVFCVLPQMSFAQDLRMPVQQIPASSDPSLIHDISSALISGQIFESLYEFDAHNSIRPRLALNHVISPDGKVIRMQIDTRRKFSDGTRLTANRVVSSLSEIIAKLGPQCAWAFDELEGFHDKRQRRDKRFDGLRALSEAEIEFRLVRPFPHLMQVLSAPYFVVFLKRGAKYYGTGEYEFEVRSARMLVLKKKPDATIPTTAPGRIIFTLCESHEECYRRAQEHAIDIAQLPYGENEVPVGFRRLEYDYLQAVVLIMNTQSPPFRVASDRRDFARTFTSAVRKSEYDWKPVDVGLPFSNEMSFESLVTEKDKKYRTNRAITIYYSDSTATLNQRANDGMRKELSSLGYVVKFERLGIGPLLERFQEGNFQAALTGYVPDYLEPGAMLAPFIQSGQQYNSPRYRNREVDRLLSLARNEMNKVLRDRIYKKVIEILNHDCPVVFLGSEEGKYIVSDQWQFPASSGLGMHTLKLRDVRFTGRPS
jgi:ABC-type transport system substrate-binding protein